MLRELQAVTDAAAAGQWRWATAAEALTAMQDLVRETISQGRDAVDQAALAAQLRLFRSAVLIGASQTAGRSGAPMKKHNALAAASSTARTITCGSPGTGGSRLTTTAANATSA